MMYQLFCSGFAVASVEVGVYESLADLMIAANEDFLAKAKDIGELVRLEWNSEGGKVFLDADQQEPDLMWGYPIVRVG